MTLVYSADSEAPATHAIVIGIGSYPHLVGGTGRLAPDTLGMRQLSSPPVSARAFADWLLEKYHNPQAPLGSLELLLSEGDQPADYTSPRDDQSHSIELATLEALKRAIRAWYDRADGDLDSVAIFYYCGHGIAKGEEVALLARDFGASRHSIMENAIDFDALKLAMDHCRARKQCFFIDACRNMPGKLLKLTSMGNRDILDARLDVIHPQDRDFPIFYGTARDYQAHGLAGKVSRFTEAVLVALNGVGSDDAGGRWAVDLYSLGKGISSVLKLGNRRPGVPQQQSKIAGEFTGFELHVLQGVPEVPVLLKCNPTAANEFASLTLHRKNGNPLVCPPQVEGWKIQLEVESYKIDVDFDSAATYHPLHDVLQVRPPYREKELMVNS